MMKGTSKVGAAMRISLRVKKNLRICKHFLLELLLPKRQLIILISGSVLRNSSEIQRAISTLMMEMSLELSIELSEL
jgi:hypothetical protein